MNTVVLISCTKSKRKVKSCAARLMYDTSDLFRKSLAYAEVISEDIFVISAKYGLVPLNQVIEYYDETLKGKRKAEKDAWGKKVATQISEVFDVKNTEFVILSGRDYYAPLQSYLPHIKLPLGNLTLFKRPPALELLTRDAKEDRRV